MKLKPLLSSMLLALCIGTVGAAQAETVLKLGYTATNDSHYGAAATVFGDELAKRTNGRYTLQQFPSSALGGEREMIEAVQLGTQDMVITSTGPVGNFVPEVASSTSPSCSATTPRTQGARWSHRPGGAEEVPGQGPGGRGLAGERLPPHDQQQAPNQPFRPMSGLKIRTMENKVHMAAFKTIGALPTPMAMNELFTALQQGTVDGQENPIPVILSTNSTGAEAPLADRPRLFAGASADVQRCLEQAERRRQEGLPRSRQLAAAANRKRVNDDEDKGIARSRGPVCRWSRRSTSKLPGRRCSLPIRSTPRSSAPTPSRRSRTSSNPPSHPPERTGSAPRRWTDPMRHTILTLDRRRHQPGLDPGMPADGRHGCALGFWQVVTRFVLSRTLDLDRGIDVRMTLIWMVMLGTVAAFRQGALVSVDLMLRLSKGRLADHLRWVITTVIWPSWRSGVVRHRAA
jgi:hypothetical protein